MSEFPTYHVLIVKTAIRQFILIIEAQQIVLWHRFVLWLFFVHFNTIQSPNFDAISLYIMAFSKNQL